MATEPYELPGGCEDPRVVQVGGTYYMTYTGYDGTSARLCLATSRNLLRWTKHGPLFSDFVTRGVDKPWSKSGAILTRKLKGKYYMYFGDKDIYYATSTDLIHWTPGPVDEPVMRPQAGTYTEELLEPGPPPLITENGKILLIHNAAAKDPDGKLIYRAGQALIDPIAPTQELARLTTPFLVPDRRKRPPARSTTWCSSRASSPTRASGSCTTGRETPESASCTAERQPRRRRATSSSFSTRSRITPATAKAIRPVTNAGKMTNHTAIAAIVYDWASFRAKSVSMAGILLLGAAASARAAPEVLDLGSRPRRRPPAPAGRCR